MTELQGEGATRWERRRELTHHRLIEAGERLFREQGFDATTVEEIAVTSDVAKGTFFNHFPSKEALLGEILYLRMQSVLSSLSTEVAPAYEQVWRMLIAVRAELAPYSSLFPRMFAYVLTNPPLPALHGEPLTLSVAISRLIRAGQVEGEYRSGVDAEAAGMLLATYFFHLCMVESVCGQSGDFSWEVRMQAVLNLLYLGLRPSVDEDAPFEE
jgi:AcrR family transcriptional regulator